MGAQQLNKWEKFDGLQRLRSQTLIKVASMSSLHPNVPRYTSHSLSRVCPLSNCEPLHALVEELHPILIRAAGGGMPTATIITPRVGSRRVSAPCDTPPLIGAYFGQQRAVHGHHHTWMKARDGDLVWPDT
jgi:hypothetical protein